MAKNHFYQRFARKSTRVVQSAAHACAALLFPATAAERMVETMTPEDLRDLLSISEHGSRRTTVALFRYRDSQVRSIIWLLKYRGNRRAALLLGGALYEFLIDMLVDETLFRGVKEPLLVPVPLSAARRRERGFNQLELMARAMPIHTPASNPPFTLHTRALVKTRHTKPQTALRRKERMENVVGSFRANEKIVRGRFVILFDDVTTTGSTLTEAARALTRAGAKRVFCIALAK